MRDIHRRGSGRPGVDEIFATFRILEMVTEKERVVIEMAPTEHALELLRTPERLLTWTRLLLKTLAAHRTLPLAQDAAVEVATVFLRSKFVIAVPAPRRGNFLRSWMRERESHATTALLHRQL